MFGRVTRTVLRDAGLAGPDVPMSLEAISGAKPTSSSANRLVAEEDASLVAAAKARDTHAFELLVERNERKIFQWLIA